MLVDLHIFPASGAEFTSSRKRRGMMNKLLNERGEEQLLTTNRFHWSISTEQAGVPELL